MFLQDIQRIFNRALAHTFHRKKLLLIFGIQAFCGILVVFFRGVALQSGHWVAMSMTFLPIFLCAGVMLSAGILLIRIYHDEVKKRELSYRKILGNSWEIIIGASYFSVPIILCYLLLWMLLGVFVLLGEIPGIGEFFSVILSFTPFILNLGAVVLVVLNGALLFFVAPILALKGFNRLFVTQTLVKRLGKDLFGNILLMAIASLPLLATLALLVTAASMTGPLCDTCHSTMHIILRWFFIMIPFTALLSPSVVFFFNFAAESHVLIQHQENVKAAG